MVTTPIHQGRYRATRELNWPTLKHRHLLRYPQLTRVRRRLLLLPHGLVLKGRLGRQPVRTELSELHLQLLLGLCSVPHWTSSPLERVRWHKGSSRHWAALPSPRLRHSLLVRLLQRSHRPRV